MPTDEAEDGIRIRDPDGRNIRRAPLLAEAASGAGLRMNHRREERVCRETARMCFNREGASVFWAFPEAHLAAQALPRKAGVGINDGNAHLGLADIREIGVKGSRRAGLHAGQVLTHEARRLARDEIGRAERNRAIDG